MKRLVSMFSFACPFLTLMPTPVCWRGGKFDGFVPSMCLVYCLFLIHFAYDSPKTALGAPKAHFEGFCAGKFRFRSGREVIIWILCSSPFERIF